MKTLIIPILLVSSLFLIALEFGPGYGQRSLASPVMSSRKLDANTISTWFYNSGQFNFDIQNQVSGFEWPKGTGLTARFASGMWIGAKVGNDTLIAIAYYVSEYFGGYNDTNGGPHGENDPLYRIYRLNLGINDNDRMLWPNSLLGNSNQGAPVYFDTAVQSWKPCDIGNQTMYYVYTDSYPQRHTAQPGRTVPLKADIKQLNFSFDAGGEIGQIVFSQFTIINRGNSPWMNTYFAIWYDDDLGNSTDDKVGCDSSLNMAYTYNADDFDENYCGIHPPAVTFDLLRGAVSYTGSASDTVFDCRCNSKIVKTCLS